MTSTRARKAALRETDRPAIVGDTDVADVAAATAEPDGLFTAAFALSPTAVVVLDDLRRLRAVSDAACALLERSREGLLSHRIDDHLEPSSRARLRAVWPGCLRAETWVHEVLLVRADGSLRPVVLSARSHVVPGRHLVTFDHDTDHRRGEEDLEQLFEDSPDLMVVAGEGGYLIRANPACERTLGYSQAELQQQPFLDLVHREDVPATTAMQERLRAGATVSAITHRVRCRDGGYRTVSWHVVRAPGQGLFTAVGRTLGPSADAHGAGAGAGAERRTAEPLPVGVREPGMQDWLGDERLLGIEPTLVWVIERQLDILDDVTREAPEPRIAALRCALALRQALVEMGSIVDALRRSPNVAHPGTGPDQPQDGLRARRVSDPMELTEREREVLRLVVRGHDNRMIGGELFLAEVTVKKHISRLMEKLDVDSRSRLLLEGIRLGVDR